jgi:HK97 family phage prohead protease
MYFQETNLQTMYQIKSIPARVKDVDEKSRTVQGYFSVFGNVDSDNDIIDNGAFKRSIDQRGPGGSDRIMHLWQHNPTMPLGKPKELREDEIGLFFTTEISDTTYGLDAVKLYRDGVLSEHSIGFEIVKARNETVDGKEVAVLTELKLWEGSSVTWGANEMARGGMKGVSTDWIKERYTILQQALRSGDYTDETFKSIENQLNWLAKNYIESEPSEPATPQEPAVSPDLLKSLQIMNLKRGIRNGISRTSTI